MLVGLLNQPERILRAGGRKGTWAQPSRPEVTSCFVAGAAVDDRRSERGAADRILQSDRETADSDRTERETTDRQAKSERHASERTCKADRNASDGDETEREAAKCEAANRNVANRDDAFRGPRPHGDRIEPHADVHQRPLADRDRRLVLEAVDEASALDAGATRQPRRIAPNAIVAHRFLADRADADRRAARMRVAVHADV